jgi:hypothetical protein
VPLGLVVSLAVLAAFAALVDTRIAVAIGAFLAVLEVVDLLRRWRS